MAPRLTYPYSYNGFTFVSSRKGIDGKKITKIICFCGMEFEGSEGGVKTGNKKSCGCLGKPRKTCLAIFH